jgi:DNA-directed RNA polymerase subunit E'/Rpb7
MRTIIEDVVLPSKYLTYSYIKNILEIIKVKLGTCTKLYGYVYKIYDDVEVIDSRIDTGDCSNVFTIKYSFDSIKPEINSTYIGCVSSIHEEGVFCTLGYEFNVKNFEVLLIGGKYNSTNLSYAFEQCGCVVNVNDKIKVRLNNVLFKKDRFYSVGTHSH